MPSDPDTLMRLLYLSVLLVGVGGFFLVRQPNLGRRMRDLLVWGLIFVMVIIAYGFRDTLREELFPSAMVQVDADTIELARGSDGHFHAELTVNGTRVRFMVDTGASDIVLSLRDAGRVGIDPDRLAFTGRAQTANGSVGVAPVRLGEVQLGRFTDTAVPAMVSDGGLDGSLLGMSYLDRFARIEISGDTLRLSR